MLFIVCDISGNITNLFAILSGLTLVYDLRVPLSRYLTDIILESNLIQGHALTHSFACCRKANCVCVPTLNCSHILFHFYKLHEK